MYCDKQALIDRYGEEELQRYAWDQDSEIINDAKVDQACTDASETIDLYIGSTTQLPLDPVPPILARIAAEIARYTLQDDNPLDEARTRYESALRTLKDIAAGRASLGTPESTSTIVDAMRDDSDRIFTRESLADF